MQGRNSWDANGNHSMNGDDPMGGDELMTGSAPMGAVAVAGTANLSLEGLGAACAACRRCGLAEGRQQVVLSRGNPGARLMLIGEAPGAQEDASGLPFVGRAGQLLDQLLAGVHLDSNRELYICNVVKCRPTNNRKPTGAEMAACRPWLDRQISLVNPPLILLAGASALEGVVGIRGGITKLRGQWRQGSGDVLAGRWLMPLFHPSYLLRNGSEQQGSPRWLTRQDLQQVRSRLDQLGQRLE
jgi:DNA polymerase